MEKNYEELFTNIIAKHLHKLVEEISEKPRQDYRRILVREDVMEIRYIWPPKIKIEGSEINSQFIPRLSFWLWGLREKFNNQIEKEEVVKVLIETLRVAFFCYFEYGSQKEIEDEIHSYCQEVDRWMNDKILIPRFENFQLSQKFIPLINNYIPNLRHYNINVKDLFKCQKQN